MSAQHCRPLAEEYLGNRSTAGRSTMKLTGNTPLPVSPLLLSHRLIVRDLNAFSRLSATLPCTRTARVHLFHSRPFYSVADLNRFIPARTVSTFNRTGFWLSQSHLMRSTSGREGVLIMWSHLHLLASLVLPPHGQHWSLDIVRRVKVMRINMRFVY